MRGLRTAAATVALSAFVLSMASAETSQPPGGKGGGRGGFGMQNIMRGGSAMLLTNASVQTELKLSDEQKTKFKDFADKQSAKMREMFADGGFDRERMQEVMKESAEAAEKVVKDTLNKDQMKRFSEIKFQQAGVAAFNDKDVQDALKLKDEQKEKIKGINEDMAADLRELMQSMRGGGGGGNFQELNEKRKALQTEAMEKAQGVLSGDQKTKFKEILGKPFEMKVEDMRRPGGGDDRPRGKGDRGKGKGGEKKSDPPKSNPKIDD